MTAQQVMEQWQVELPVERRNDYFGNGSAVEYRRVARQAVDPRSYTAFAEAHEGWGVDELGLVFLNDSLVQIHVKFSAETMRQRGEEDLLGGLRQSYGDPTGSDASQLTPIKGISEPEPFPKTPGFALLDDNKSADVRGAVWNLENAQVVFFASRAAGPPAKGAAENFELVIQDSKAVADFNRMYDLWWRERSRSSQQTKEEQAEKARRDARRQSEVHERKVTPY